MRLARFAFVISILPGVIPAQDAGQATRTGHEAIDSSDFTTAVYFLKQAVAAEPKHVSAWKDLCRAYLALDQVDAAVDACLRQIDVSPQSPGAYGALGARFGEKASATKLSPPCVTRSRSIRSTTPRMPVWGATTATSVDTTKPFPSLRGPQ
jgi:thioredoxin-like negative regulator of GroEL